MKRVSGKALLFSFLLLPAGLALWLGLFRLYGPDAPLSEFSGRLSALLNDPAARESLIRHFSVLMLLGLAVSLGKKAGVTALFLPGACLLGGYFSLLAGQRAFSWLLCLAAGALGGAAVGLLSAVPKARSLAGLFLSGCLTALGFRQTLPSPIALPSWGMAGWIGEGTATALLLMLACAGVLSFFRRKTALGFALEALEHNPSAARYAGFREKRLVYLALAAAGALAGLAGGLAFSGSADARALVFLSLHGLAAGLLGGGTLLPSVLLSTALIAFGQAFSLSHELTLAPVLALLPLRFFCLPDGGREAAL